MDANVNVPIDEARIAEFCQRNHISELSLFGSVLRDDFTETSDIDVLVEFEEGHVPGLEFVDMKDELEEIFGRSVDLLTPRSLSRYFADRVMAERKIIYDAA